MDYLPKDVLLHHILPQVESDQLWSLLLTSKRMYRYVAEHKRQRVRQRLNDLISDDLLNYLSERGVIAGGSVVYALNDFVPKSSVGDIDVFINNRTTFLEIIDHIKTQSPDIDVLAIQNYFDNFNEPGDKISVITLSNQQPSIVEQMSDLYTAKLFNDICEGKEEIERPKKGNINIQLILYKYSTPFDIINYFDLDYVQCAFTQGNLYTTTICRNAHVKKQVMVGIEWPPVERRVQKALNKGFKVANCYNRSSRNGMRFEEIKKTLQKTDLVYFERLKENAHVYHFNEIHVFDFVKTHERTYGKKHNVSKIDYGEVKVGPNEEMCIQRKDILVEIELLVELREKKFQMTPLKFGDHQIDYCNNQTQQELRPGVYIGHAQIYRVQGQSPLQQSYRLMLHDIVDDKSIPLMSFRDKCKNEM